MQNNQTDLRSTVAQGWSMMLMAFILILFCNLMKSAIHGDFHGWIKDPGMGGLPILVSVMVIYIFMPMLVRTISAQWFRWVVVALAVFFTMFFVAHQLSHVLAGDREFDIIQALDFTHHTLGIWVVVLASKWARQGAVERMQAGMAPQAA